MTATYRTTHVSPCLLCKQIKRCSAFFLLFSWNLHPLRLASSRFSLPPSFHFSLPVFIPYPFLYRVPMFPGRICQKRHAECTFKSGITMDRLLRCQGSCKDLQKSSSHLTHLSDAVLQGSNVTFLNFSGFCVGLKNSLHYIQTGEAKCCHPLRMFLKKYNFVFGAKNKPQETF